MNRVWNPMFVLREAGRAAVLSVAVAPLWLVLALVMAVMWAGWMLICGVQIVLMGRRLPAQRNTYTPPARTRPEPGPRRTLALPPRTARAARKPEEPRRVGARSDSDLQLLLAGMARHAWPKQKVIDMLRGWGAAWAWSQRIEGAVGPRGAPPKLALAREHVQLRYRGPGGFIWPAARIEAWFDGDGRLIYASAPPLRIRL